MLVSIPYLRVTHGFVSTFIRHTLPVSIPYLRVTHSALLEGFTTRQLGFNPLSTGHAPNFNGDPFYGSCQFQSPIYGSRTSLTCSHLLSSSCFNPLSTGHAHLSGCPESVSSHVSIPYLRVTHSFISILTKSFSEFQSPIYGSRTESTGSKFAIMDKFQSPIYGSRTKCKQPYKVLQTRCFNPLSTGHAHG